MEPHLFDVKESILESPLKLYESPKPMIIDSLIWFIIFACINDLFKYWLDGSYQDEWSTLYFWLNWDQFQLQNIVF